MLWTIRWTTPKDVEDVSLEIGVTGRPSLAEGSQKAVHRLLGFREPLGWDGQLPFEPGIVVSYERARLFAQVTSGGARILAMNADARVRLGNVATDLRTGACLTLGWNVNGCHSAWLQLRKGFGIGLMAGLHGDIVLHNLSLDGSTFTGGPRVSKKTAVAEGMVGVSLQFKGLALGWTAIHRGKEYDTQAKSHTFSRISLSF